jgi:DNA helicase-2/ATP-dependent DNA helicase PcrA
MADLLDDLDPEQRAAAEALSGPVCIIAGAGTGKTRTITYRLAHAIDTGAVDAGRALAVTHSRKAAREMAARLEVLGAGRVEAKTFHAAGLKVARQFWARTGRLEGSVRVMGDREGWVMWRDSVRAVRGREPDDGAVRDVIDEVAWARSRLIRPDAYERSAASADSDPGVGPDVVVKCWGRYERAKGRRGLVDYADLLEIASDLLEGNSDIAARVRRKWAYLTLKQAKGVGASCLRSRKIVHLQGFPSM